MNEVSPIIIIGAARSGTKILRDVLASVDGVVSVPYDVNYIWRSGSETASSDVLDPRWLSEDKIKSIRKSIFDIAGAKPGDILIEKTVSNTLRVPYVDRVFPNARYVHLIRDGRDVTESAMRQWRAKPNAIALWTKLKGMPLSNFSYVIWFAKNFIKGLGSGRAGGSVWGPRFAGIDSLVAGCSLAEVCARQWVESVTCGHRDLAAVRNSSERVFEIKYEDLVQDESTLRDLVRDLKLPNQDKIVESYRSRCDPLSVGKGSRLEHDEDAKVKKIISQICPSIWRSSN